MRGGGVVPVPRVDVGRDWSLSIVTTAYLAATAVGVVTLGAVGDGRPLLAAFLADLAATAVIWFVAVGVRNGSVYDPYWSVVPPLLALWWMSLDHPDVPAAREVLVVVAIVVWAVRLTANWARGWPGLQHEDWRYRRLYRDWPTPWPITSLVGVHLVPTLVVFVGLLPVEVALVDGTRAVGALDWIALVVCVGAAVLELVADEQLRRFNATKETGDVIEVGLWARSRHPNYLGELTFWWGLWLFGLAAHPESWWWTLAGPVGMTALFAFASIPMMDARSVERRPAYAEVMQRVPALLPRLTRQTGRR